MLTMAVVVAAEPAVIAFLALARTSGSHFAITTEKLKKHIGRHG